MLVLSSMFGCDLEYHLCYFECVMIKIATNTGIEATSAEW